MSNVELKLKDTINDNDIYDIYIDNVYVGGLEANYDPRINSFYIENIKKSDSYKAGHLLEDVVNYLYNNKGYDLGCLPLEKYRSYYEELGFTPFIHHGNDIFYHKIHNEESMKTDEFLTKSNKRHESITENNQLLKVLENTESVFNSIKAKLIEQGFKNLKVNVGDWSPLYKKVMFYINYSNKFSYEQTKVIKKLSSVETIDQIKITIEDDIWEYNTEDLSAEGTVTFKIECPYSEKISNKDAEVIANIFVDKVKNFINKIYDDNDVYYHKIHKGENMKTDEFLNEVKKIINEDKSSQKNEGNLIPDIIEKYGDLTIPEFIDALMGVQNLDESMNEISLNTLERFNMEREFPISKLVDGLIDSLRINDSSLDLLRIDRGMFHPNPGELRIQYATSDSENKIQINFMLNYKDEFIDTNGIFITIEPNIYRCKSYLKKAVEEVNFNGIYCPLQDKDDLKQTIKEINAALRLISEKSIINYNNEMDILFSKQNKISKEFEELAKARRAARANKKAQNTTVGQALTQKDIIAKIKALQNPTPEQLAKILAAIE